MSFKLRWQAINKSQHLEIHIFTSIVNIIEFHNINVSTSGPYNYDKKVFVYNTDIWHGSFKKTYTK